MKSFILLLFSIFFMSVLSAQDVPYNNTNGIAIKGYDPVAYFLQQKPVEGKDEFSYDWSGSKWKFASEADMDSFKMAPQKYCPQYGGYCAYGLSENHKSPADPNAWTIIDNKLYLNYNMQVKEMWMKNSATRIEAADKNWPALKK